ncbi:MAG: YcfL family protein [Verrucomicrobiota bacterium]
MKTSLFSGLFALALMAGCASVNTVEPTNQRATPSAIPSQVEIRDSELADWIEIVQVNESIVSGNLMKVQVEVQSISSRYRGFNYRFIWIEQNGMAVTSPDPVWRGVQLPSGGVQFVSAVAPNPRVVDFRLQLIKAGDARDIDLNPFN